MADDLDSLALADIASLRAVFEAIPHCRDIGLRVLDLTPRFGKMVLDYRDDLIGNPETGVLHGAAITTLMDTVAGMAVMASVPDGTPVATLDLRIDYLKPATPGEAVIGEAECYRVARSVAFVRGVAHHGDPAAPIAHCAASFMLHSAGFVSGKGETS